MDLHPNYVPDEKGLQNHVHFTLKPQLHLNRKKNRTLLLNDYRSAIHHSSTDCSNQQQTRIPTHGTPHIVDRRGPTDRLRCHHNIANILNK